MWEEAERGRRRRLRRKREEGQGSPDEEEAQDCKGDNRRVRWSYPAAQRLFRIPYGASQAETEERRKRLLCRQTEKLYPSPLPHIRGFGGLDPRPRPPPSPFMATGGGGWKSWAWRRPL